MVFIRPGLSECHNLLLFCRFEFDMSVEDAQRRELSVCVKNASSSFMNRDKDVIGQVSLPGLPSAGQNILQNKDYPFQISRLTNIYVPKIRPVFILNYELMFCIEFYQYFNVYNCLCILHFYRVTDI